MSRTDFLPARDEDFNAWAVNFSALVAAAPVAYGLLAADATALAGLVTAFTAALTAATNPGTRTAVTVASKETARVALSADIRSLVRRIQAVATVTAAQKTALGISVIQGIYSLVPAPATSPLLNIVAVTPRQHAIRVVDETTPTRRARPFNAAGAEVYAFIGAAGVTPPADLEHWEFKGMATRSDYIVQYNADDAGKQATIVTRWYNRRGQTGPVSNPISGTIAA